MAPPQLFRGFNHKGVSPVLNYHVFITLMRVRALGTSTWFEAPDWSFQDVAGSAAFSATFYTNETLEGYFTARLTAAGEARGQSPISPLKQRMKSTLWNPMKFNEAASKSKQSANTHINGMAACYILIRPTP